MMQIYSIFGQIEDAAAQYMLSNYPDCHQIPLTEFPDRRLIPDIWENTQGQEARYGIMVPKTLVSVFEQTIASLRS